MLRRLHFLRPIIRADKGQTVTIPLLLAALTIVIAIVGWTSVLFDGSLNSITRILIRTARSFALSPDNLNAGNRLTDVATFLGVLTTLISVLFISVALLGELFAKLVVRYFLSAHAIVIGDTTFARRAAILFEAEGFIVVHVVARDSPRTFPKGPARLRFDLDPALLPRLIRAPNARHVQIDLENDAATLKFGAIFFETTRGLKSAARRATPETTLSLVIGDETMGHQYADILTGEVGGTNDGGEPQASRLLAKFIVPNRVVARSALADYPLFATADLLGQQRIHAIIYGFGDLGEKLFDQVFIASLTPRFGIPRVTVVDKNATGRQLSFRSRRPHVLTQLPVEFLNITLGSDPFEDEPMEAAVARMLEADAEAPATAIFICLPTDQETIQASLTLRRLATRHGRLRCPIFYRWKDNVPGEAFPCPQADVADANFVRMMLTDEAITAEICHSGFRELLAEALHASYVKTAIGAGPSRSWASIPSTLRQANIRSADHLPAKLWSLNADPKVWKLMGSSLETTDLKGEVVTLLRRAAEMMEMDQPALARLEHDRWCLERKLEGWRRGAEKDLSKRTHPSIVDWDELRAFRDPAEVDKDYAQIRAAIRYLIEANDRA